MYSGGTGGYRRAWTGGLTQTIILRAAGVAAERKRMTDDITDDIGAPPTGKWLDMHWFDENQIVKAISEGISKKTVSVMLTRLSKPISEERTSDIAVIAAYRGDVDLFKFLLEELELKYIKMGDCFIAAVNSLGVTSGNMDDSFSILDIIVGSRDEDFQLEYVKVVYLIDFYEGQLTRDQPANTRHFHRVVLEKLEYLLGVRIAQRRGWDSLVKKFEAEESWKGNALDTQQEEKHGI